MKPWLLFFLLLLPLCTLAQDTVPPEPVARWGAYVESYYSHDLGRTSPRRPEFLYNFARNQEFNVNLALLWGEYNAQDVRGKLGLMAGNYAQYNLAAEPAALRSLYEAHAGVKIWEDLWLEAGVLPSPFGPEGAIGADNYVLTQSLVADNSPYFLTGARLSWERDPRWYFAGFVVNGWQNIQETPANRNKAVCTQVILKPRKNLTLNSALFLGNEAPDSAAQYRVFHDFYAKWEISEKTAVLAVLDAGIQDTGTTWGSWLGANVQLQQQVSPRLRTTLRAERYHDPGGLLAQSRRRGLQAWGLSVNVDHQLHPRALARVELRSFLDDRFVFLWDRNLSRLNVALTGSLSVRI